jgi:hypothetical protein
LLPDKKCEFHDLMQNGKTLALFNHLLCAPEFECDGRSIPFVADATGGSFCGGDRWPFRLSERYGQQRPLLSIRAVVDRPIV